MTRRLLSRGIVLTLTLALLAPLGAACFPEAPGHAMACCPPDRDGPMLRPCCAMTGEREGLPRSAAAPALAPVPVPATFVPPAETQRFHRDALRVPFTRPIGIRLLTSVFLI